MTDIVRPGAGILFMKVGTHAQESLDTIISRKTREIEEAGHAFWGYGGNSCHPQTMVQPFVRSFEQRGQVIYLCMHEMESKHFAEPIRADEYSEDGYHWTTIPTAINVRGSRYALVIDELRRDEFDLPLDRTRVAIGNSKGRTGDKYVMGRVDKACLELQGTEATPSSDDTKVIRIGLVARIKSPYAVHVRNRP